MWWFVCIVWDWVGGWGLGWRDGGDGGDGWMEGGREGVFICLFIGCNVLAEKLRGLFCMYSFGLWIGFWFLIWEWNA